MKTYIPSEIATRFVAALTLDQTTYAVSRERGAYRGFAALHDLMDANDALWTATGITDEYDIEAHTDLLNAAIGAVNAILLG